MCLIHRVFTTTPVVTASLILLASHHPSAYGQVSDDAIEPQMQEVTVTVQRREQRGIPRQIQGTQSMPHFCGG